MALFNRALLALAFVLVFPAAAHGQPQPNAIVAHFRAYQAALDQGDLVTAEREAASALEASVARDGDGANTGVLAINLAQVRLRLSRRDAAYEPALRAHAIASAGQSNLDPLLAQMILGRAELTQERWREGQNRLAPAIEQARTRPDLDAETYNAAADLGRWMFSEGLYEGALDAWEVAKQKADATPGNNDYARAEARMGHAAALFSRAIVRTIGAQARPTDTRLGGNADAAFDTADAELLEAQNILGTVAYTPSPDGGFTLGQRMYANVLAWRTLLRAFTESRGLRTLAQRAPDFELPPNADPRPLCPVNVVGEPMPRFPPGASSTFSAGAAVIRFQVDASGNVIDSQVAAAIPERWFREAVEAVAPQWRLALADDAPADCRYNEVEFVPIKFYFRN